MCGVTVRSDIWSQAGNTNKLPFTSVGNRDVCVGQLECIGLLNSGSQPEGRTSGGRGMNTIRPVESKGVLKQREEDIRGKGHPIILDGIKTPAPQKGIPKKLSPITQSTPAGLH